MVYCVTDRMAVKRGKEKIKVQ